ncbi:MAG: glycoside hydrolase family protein [Actinomycetia bacterium]|jgi:endoglucanase|nr:glycoside hydrolase family protein [Actinomycetes bacterium]
MKFPWPNNRSTSHEAAGDPVAGSGRKHRFRSLSRPRTALVALPLAAIIGVGGFFISSLASSHVSAADAADAAGTAISANSARLVSDDADDAITPLHTRGADIVDAAGKTVTITGVNWFGLETGTFAPDGLWARNYKSMINQIVASGFNAIRLPYSNALFQPGKNTPNGIDYALNPDLQGLAGLPLMDKIVHAATSRGLMVILDQHRPDQNGQSCLPYSGDLSEQQWIADWAMLAEHYRDNPLVIGADLHNEPCDPATWGTGNPQTDWRLMAEQAGDAILKVNPNWLVIVEGVSSNDGQSTWWGGDLAAAKAYPVQLSEPDHLVYEAHDYGPDVYNQPWFLAQNFPANLAGIWNANWAYLSEQNIAPVLLGEFGGSVGDTTEGVWQKTLVAFLKQHHISYTYWCMNPNSGDTGGVLDNDWKTVDQAKLNLLHTYMAPLLKQQ